MADHSKRKAETHPESHVNKKTHLNDGSSSTPVHHNQTISPFKVGKWLPSDRDVINNFIKNLIVKVQNDPKPLAPVMIELKNLIESSPDVYMYFNLMLSQVPQKYHTNPAGGPQVRDYMVLIELINEILTSSPTFNTTGLVGFPINALLDYSMGTEAGFACFLNQKVNQQLKKVLNEWGKFLCSPESAYVLTPESGWFGTDKDSKDKFLDTFVCDKTQPHYGFKSWDNFFTRHFKTGVRPIDQDPTHIVNACESAPFALVQGVDVRKRNQFWVKGQPYSIQHMLNNDPRVDEFVGGTVYQAFLSALSYHRWHAPVSGRVVSTQVVDGTYYSEAIAEGFDESAPNDSQGYITELATRGIMYFQADNVDIGLMVFIAVGMAEVSSCQFTVSPGQHVNKGEEIGMFHFGGSTHCLLFRPGVEIDWQLGQEPGLHAHNIYINSKIAVVKSSKKK